MNRETAGFRPAAVPPVALAAATRSPGPELDPEGRVATESRFGHDFARVRVHAMSGEPESGPGGGGGPASPLHNLPGAPHACLLQRQIPFNRSGILRSKSGTVGERFEMHAEWDSAPFRGESSYCAAECGEYHQFIKGHMLSSSDPSGANPQDVSGKVFGGQPLQETVFQEDGLDGKPKARYGHRAEPTTMNEAYRPTRASGPVYQGGDFPNVSIGTWADIDLTFLGKTMDVCNNVETSSDTWRVVYKGVIRP